MPRRAKTQTCLSNWEEMRDETLTRCFWSHPAPVSVNLNQNSSTPPRECLEMCADHYWYPAGRVRNAKHPAVTVPQNEEGPPTKGNNTLINNQCPKWRTATVLTAFTLPILEQWWVNSFRKGSDSVSFRPRGPHTSLSHVLLFKQVLM